MAYYRQSERLRLLILDLKHEIARILKDEGFIKEVNVKDLEHNKKTVNDCS